MRDKTDQMILKWMQFKTIFLFGLILSIGMSCQSLFAAVDVAEQNATINLAKYSQYFLDDDHSLAFESALNSVDRFQPVAPKSFINFGITTSVLWLTTDLANSSDQVVKRYIKIDYPIIDDVRILLFNPASGEKQFVLAGDKVPLAERDIPVLAPVIPISIPAKGKIQVLMRAETSSNLVLPLELETEATLLSNMEWSKVINGVVYGVSIGLTLFNLFLYFSVRMNLYLSYVGLLVLSGTFMALVDGAGLYLPGLVGYQDTFVVVMIYASNVSAAQFTRYFLGLQKKRNWQEKLTNFLSYANLAGLALVPLIDFQLSCNLVLMLGLLVTNCMLVLGIIGIMNKNNSAIIFTIAFAIPAISASASIAAAVGLLDNLLVAVYGNKVAYILQMVLLSIGVGGVINQLKDEKIRSQKEAQEALEQSAAKGEFLAKMSHEIRTPMNGVIGLAQLLNNTKLNSTQSHYVDTIISSGNALLGVINDVLDYAKIEAGKMKTEKIEFDLFDLLSEVGTLFQIQAMEKGLSFEGYVDPNVPRYVQSDPTRFRQILLNFLSNAFKFTNEGSIQVFVTCESRGENGVIKVLVKDTGIGISVEGQQNLFSNFEQAEENTARKFGGTGLGLAICKELANLLGGDVGLNSTVSKGSEFWFTFVTPIPEREFVTQNDGRKTLAYSHNLLHVMLVDPDFDYALTLVRELSTRGMLVTHRKTVEEGYETFREGYEQFRIDMVILTEHESVTDLLRMVQKIKQLPNTKNTEFLLLTKIGSDISADKAQVYGIQHVLPKPVFSFQLYDFVTRPRLHALQHDEDRHSDRSQPLRGMRVLVADDNKVNIMVVQGMLKQFQLDVTLANNGAEALEIYRQQADSIDLILMDCEMPTMNGYQATEQIRAWEQEHNIPRTPIIALTAHAVDEYIERCVAAGMDDVLTKPINVRSLKDKLFDLSKAA